MIKRKREQGAADFAALTMGKLTWLGLAVVTIGWVLLIGSAAVAELIAAKTGRPISPAFRGDLIEIAKCLVGSGFGLAVIGALQNGFGTLNRFFNAVLARSTQREAEPARVEPIVEAPSAMPQAAAKRRPYRLFPDGSVEVETILGTRLFKTMAEAREFL